MFALIFDYYKHLYFYIKGILEEGCLKRSIKYLKKTIDTSESILIYSYSFIEILVKAYKTLCIVYKIEKRIFKHVRL